MKCKLFPTPIRLAVSLACVFGFSTLYGQANGAPRVSFAQGNDVRYSYEANYRSYEYARGIQYDPALYRAAFPQSFDFGYDGKYATRYSRNYSREYGAYYTQLSNYNLRGSDNYGRRDFVPVNQRAQRAHYVRYSDYQSGKYDTSLQVSSYGNYGNDQDRRC